MSPRKSYLQFAFMPFAPLREEVRIGNIRFCPVSRRQITLRQYIENSDIRAQVAMMFKQYKTEDGKPVNNITLAIVGKLDFRVLTDKEREDLGIAEHILSFLCIDENKEFSWCTSDNFEVIYQNFILGDLGIAPQSGAIHSVASGGWQIKDIKFMKPVCVNTSGSFGYDEQLRSAFETCLVHHKTDIECRLILRSLGRFYDAYKNNPDVSHDSRILLMAMAFETLLNFGNRQDFRDKIQELLGDPSEETFPTAVKLDKKKITENLTQKQAWANSFYELRNAIIHGDLITINDLHYKNKGHFYIADRFYRECVKRILENKEYYGKYIPAFGKHMAPYSAISTPRKLNEYLLNQEL